MSRIDLNFVATGNFSQLKTQIDQVRRSVEQLNRLSTGVGMSRDQISRIREMANQYDNLVRSSGAFYRSSVQVQGSTIKFGQGLQNQTLKLGQYFDAVKRGATATEGSLRKLAEQQVRLSQSIIRSDPFVQGKMYVDTPKKLDTIANATALARKQQELFNLALRNGAGELINWGKNTQWAGRQLSMGLTLPITLFGKTASDVFLKFDQELVRMQKVYGNALANASSQSTAKIRDDMKMLANELASGMGQAIEMTAGIGGDLAATGLEGQKLIDATRETSRLATLGEIDRQNAVKTTIALQNVFRLSTQELTESIDFLNAVENQSSLTLQDLTDAIPRAAPVVDELGGSYKDLAVMLGAMVEAGVPAAEAANAIKSSLASLINPTKETRKQLNALGIDMNAIVQSTQGKPVETFQALATAMDALDPLSRARGIEQIFGKFQFARIAALLDNINTEGTQTARIFALMKKNSEELAQTSSSELKVLTESVSGRYKRAVASLQASLVPVGEKFTEVFTSVFEFITKIIDFINKNPIVSNILTFLGIGTAVVGPLVMVTGLFANFFGFMIKGVAQIKNLANGFRSFGKVATAESLAAENAAQLLTNGLMEEADAVNIVKNALNQLNAELQEYIALSKAGAGGFRPGPGGAGPAGAGGVTPMPTGTGGPYIGGAAQAAATAAIMRQITMSGGSGSEGRRLKISGALEWAHAYPKAQLEAAAKAGMTPQGMFTKTGPKDFR